MPTIGCSFCTARYAAFMPWQHEREQRKELVPGGWTTLERGVDADNHTLIIAVGDDETDRYYPKFCPECGRKLEN